MLSKVTGYSELDSVGKVYLIKTQLEINFVAVNKLEAITMEMYNK